MAVVRRVAVLGAGSVGKALAGHLSLRGFDVVLWNRSSEVVDMLNANGGVVLLRGVLDGEFKVAAVTSRLDEALDRAELVFVTCTADAHVELASMMASHLGTSTRAVVLMPGRTFGAYVFASKLRQERGLVPPVYETQTVVHTARTRGSETWVYRVKQRVGFSSFNDPGFNVAPEIETAIPELVLESEPLTIPFSNVGCVLHPVIMLFNFARVESGQVFRFYKDGTSASVARFLLGVDEERRRLASLFAVRVSSLVEWLRTTYDLSSHNLIDLLQSNAAYEEITAPNTIYHRYIWEDVPTGLVRLAQVGDSFGIDTPYIDIVVEALERLSGSDLRARSGISDSEIHDFLARWRARAQS